MNSKMTIAAAFVFFAGLFWPGSASAEDAGCSENFEVTVCVRSASISPEKPGRPRAIVSIGIDIINRGDLPLPAALFDGASSLSFTPEDGPALFSEYSQIAGISSCLNARQCVDDFRDGKLTVLPPKSRTRATLRIVVEVTDADLALIRQAQTAAFSATLVTYGNGKASITPMTMSDFSFGKGL